MNPGKKLMKHGRTWRMVNKQIQHKTFEKSPQCDNFCRLTGATGVGYTVFRDGVKKFGKLVRDPSPESCVDEKVSGLEHAMESLYLHPSQASINAKDVRKTIAYILWRTSSNRSSRRQA
eukprot:scaffold1961_cov126-Skeletonema_marinoi.AAC.4